MDQERGGQGTLPAGRVTSDDLRRDWQEGLLTRESLKNQKFQRTVSGATLASRGPRSLWSEGRVEHS